MSLRRSALVALGLCLGLSAGCGGGAGGDPSPQAIPPQGVVSDDNLPPGFYDADGGTSEPGPASRLPPPDATAELLPLDGDVVTEWTPFGDRLAYFILNRGEGLDNPQLGVHSTGPGQNLELSLTNPTRLRDAGTIVTVRILAATHGATELVVTLNGLPLVQSPTLTIPASSKFDWRELSFEVDAGAQLDGVQLRFTAQGEGDALIRAVDTSIQERPLPKVPFVVVGSAGKVRPSGRASGASEAELFAARNEFESFQVVVNAANVPIEGVEASVASDLTGPGGATLPASQLTLYREGYYQVVTPSDLEGSPGLWPDALVPDVDPLYKEHRNAFPFDVPAGQNRAIWIDLLVPVDAPAGVYSGAIKLTAKGMASLVPVSVTVIPFTLPSTPSLKSAFGFNPGSECSIGPAGCGGNPSLRAQAKALFVRTALDNRITIANAHVQSINADTGAGLSEFRTYFLPFVKGTANTRLPGARLTTYQVNRVKEHNLAGWKAEAIAQGFGDRVFIYACDEPHFFPNYGDDAGNWALCRDELNQAKAAWPEAPRLVTAHIQSADANNGTSLVDWMVVNEELLDGPSKTPWFVGNQRPLYNDFLSEMPERNKALWLYAACGSHGCTRNTDAYNTGWAGYEIDAPASETRAMAWSAFRYSLSGTLYYDMALLISSAWETQLYSTGNGDGTLFYPGTVDRIGGSHAIPIESLRIKYVRDGYEDFELLKALRDRGFGAEAMSLTASLFPHIYDTARTDAQVQAARKKLVLRVAEVLATP